MAEDVGNGAHADAHAADALGGADTHAADAFGVTGVHLVETREWAHLVKAREGARKRAVRWNKVREDRFFEELTATANVMHAARMAGMSHRAAYLRKGRDTAFAARWRDALDSGYARLETELLRHALDGTERTETVRDGDGVVRQVRTVHAFPLNTALAIYKLHREEVERHRLARAMRDGDDPAVVLRIRAELARVRSRLAAGDGARRIGPADE